MIGVIATISVTKGKEIEFQEMMKKLVNAVNLDEEDKVLGRKVQQSIKKLEKGGKKDGK